MVSMIINNPPLLFHENQKYLNSCSSTICINNKKNTSFYYSKIFPSILLHDKKRCLIAVYELERRSPTQILM